MFQFEHLLAVTEVITAQVKTEAAAPPKQALPPPAELAASHAERAKVMELLESALEKTQSLKAHFTDIDNANLEPTSDMNWHEKQEMNSEVAELASTDSSKVPASPEVLAQTIVDGLTAKDQKGITDQTGSLAEMAKQAEPIIATFKTILDMRGLENYNASINTAPVVGFKGDNVVYVQAKSNRLPVGNVTNDSWAVFDKVPSGFDASQGTTHFFPYEGNLYVANGSKLWVRRCLPKGHPDLEKASNNWPKMYYNTWEPLGDNALPASNFSDIVPWATLSASGSAVMFKLVALTAGGELQVLQQESISTSNTFSTMSYEAKGKSSPAVAPTWSRVAYNNGKFVGYDRDYNLWDISPDFSKSTYTIENKYAVGQEDTFSEYTANDIGLVAAKKDGYLYKRIASTVDTTDAAKDGSDVVAHKTEWIKWIALEGVKDIGVASPGIILDLLTLTKSLETRYLDTQSTLWPVVQNIKTFASTHKVFLDQVNDAAKTFASEGDDEKAKIAIKVGKKALGHARLWAEILTKSVSNAQAPVMSMAKQLNGVYVDLKQQVSLLDVKLATLKGILTEQEKALSAANVGFWAGIGTMLLGVVGVIVGLATANIFIVAGAGVIFTGGLIAASVSGAKANRAAEAVAKTGTDIALVELGIKELTAIVQNFAEIDKMYSILNVFWGRMLGNAKGISLSDTVIFKMIGLGLLDQENPSYVHASQECEGLRKGAQAYQDLISAQGIRIPEEDDDEEEDDDDEAAVASLGGDGDTSQDFGVVKPLPIRKFAIQAASAKSALEQGNDEEYEVLMSQALEVQEASIASISDAPMYAGVWFDVNALKSSAGAFLISDIQSQLNVLRLSAPEAALSGMRAIGNLVQSRKNVAQSLRATIELAELMSTWSNDPFDDDSEIHEEQLKKYKKPALEFCHLARDGATIANNSFAEINHMAQAIASEVRSKIAVLRNNQQMLKIDLDRQLQSIDVPFSLKLFAPWLQVSYFINAESARLRNTYENAWREIQNTIDQHEASIVSFAHLDDQALSWVDLCKTVSRNLASTQSLLQSMGTELEIDALLYKELMVTQWHQLVGNAQEILSLFNLSAGFSQQDIRTAISFGVGRFTEGGIAELNSAEEGTSAKTLLKSALNPDRRLAKYLKTGSSTAAAFHATIMDLRTLPLAADINSGISSKTPKSLLTIVQELQNQYSNLAASNFDAVSQIMSTAEVQQIIVKKKMLQGARNDITIQRQLVYTGFVRKSILDTSEAWAAASDDFARVCSTIQNNAAVYRALMKDLDSAAAKKQKELDDYIAGIAADAIACCMISIGIGFGIASGGATGLTAVGKKAWMVISKIGTVYDHQGLGWKDAFKTWYKDLDISEQAAIIANLKSLSDNLDQASTKLSKASDLFKDAVMAVQDEALAVTRMHANLVNASEKIQILKAVRFDDDDCEEISYEWKEVAEAAEAWMDEFSKQGISPILHQFDDDVDDKDM